MGIDTAENAQAVADAFNELLRADPSAAASLVMIRHPVNAAVAHGTGIIVGDAPGGGFDLGVLGFVNSLFGDRNRVAVEVDDERGIVGFRVVDLSGRRTS